MALDDILTAIREDAEAEAAAIMADGEQTCSSIALDAEQQATRIEQETLARAASQAEMKANRIERAAHRAAAMARLNAREEFLVSLFAALDGRLARVRQEAGYRERFKGWLAEALEVLPAATRAHVDRRDLSLAREVLAERELNLVADIETAGGLVLANDEGHRVYNTLEARRDAQLGSLRTLAARIHPPLIAGPDES